MDRWNKQAIDWLLGAFLRCVRTFLGHIRKWSTYMMYACMDVDLRDGEAHFHFIWESPEDVLYEFFEFMRIILDIA